MTDQPYANLPTDRYSELICTIDAPRTDGLFSIYLENHAAESSSGPAALKAAVLIPMFREVSLYKPGNKDSALRLTREQCENLRDRLTEALDAN